MTAINLTTNESSPVLTKKVWKAREMAIYMAQNQQKLRDQKDTQKHPSKSNLNKSKLEASRNKLAQLQLTPMQLIQRKAKLAKNQWSDQEGNGGNCDDRLYREPKTTQGHSKDPNSTDLKSKTSSEEARLAEGIEQPTKG